MVLPFISFKQKVAGRRKLSMFISGNIQRSSVLQLQPMLNTPPPSTSHLTLFTIFRSVFSPLNVSGGPFGLPILAIAKVFPNVDWSDLIFDYGRLINGG